MAISLEAVQRAVEAMRAGNRYDPSQLLNASQQQSDSDWNYTDFLNSQVKQMAGMDVGAGLAAQRAQNQLGSQVSNLQRQYGLNQRAAVDDFSNRGMAYSGQHVKTQSDLGSNLIAQQGQLQGQTATYLDDLKQQVLNSKLQMEEQQRQEQMKKFQQDQAYALEQAKTQAYINTMNQSQQPPQQQAQTQVQQSPGGNMPAPQSARNSAQNPAGRTRGFSQDAINRWRQRTQSMQPQAQTAPRPTAPPTINARPVSTDSSNRVMGAGMQAPPSMQYTSPSLAPQGMPMQGMQTSPWRGTPGQPPTPMTMSYGDGPLPPDWQRPMMQATSPDPQFSAWQNANQANVGNTAGNPQALGLNQDMNQGLANVAGNPQALGLNQAMAGGQRLQDQIPPELMAALQRRLAGGM